MDRSNVPTRKRHLRHPEDRSEYLRLTPSERVELVWPLTLQAWGFLNGLENEPRFRRDVVRVTRRTGSPRALGLVMEWAALHQGELREVWKQAEAHEPLSSIEPLE